MRKLILFSLLTLFIASPVLAQTVQWQPINEGLKNGTNVNRIVVDSNNDHLYMSSLQSGAFVSVDSKSWNSLNSLFIKHPLLNVVIDPNNSSHLVAVAEERAGYAGSTTIYLSQDGGQSWIESEFPDPEEDVLPNAIAINPTHSNEVLAGEYILFKSDNGGKSFYTFAAKNVTFINQIYSIHFNPKDGNIIYLCGDMTNELQPGISKSIDNGAHWVKIPVPALNWGHQHDFALTITTNNDLYLTVVMHHIGPMGELTYTSDIYKSSDDGAHWANVTNDLPANGNLNLTADQVNPQILYAIINSDLYITKNGGMHWEKIQDDTKPLSISSVATSEGKLFAGTEDAGMYTADLSGK